MKDTPDAFLNWLSRWETDLPSRYLKDVLPTPECTALVSQDLVKGFCYTGALSSSRAAGIVHNVVQLFRNAHDLAQIRDL